jgi:hypothetical protein
MQCNVYENPCTLIASDFKTQKNVVRKGDTATKEIGVYAAESVNALYTMYRNIYIYNSDRDGSGERDKVLFSKRINKTQTKAAYNCIMRQSQNDRRMREETQQKNLVTAEHLKELQGNCSISSIIQWTIRSVFVVCAWLTITGT